MNCPSKNVSSRARATHVADTPHQKRNKVFFFPVVTPTGPRNSVSKIPCGLSRCREPAPTEGRSARPPRDRPRHVTAPADVAPYVHRPRDRSRRIGIRRCPDFEFRRYDAHHSHTPPHEEPIRLPERLHPGSQTASLARVMKTRGCAISMFATLATAELLRRAAGSTSWPAALTTNKRLSERHGSWSKA